MKKTLIYIFVLLLGPISVHAATFHFSSLQDIPRGGEGVVTLKVDTDGEKMNAVSGEVSIPGGVEIGKIITGSSIVVIWVEQPKIIGNKIVFSGITPGGFQGDRELFSFIVKPLTLYPVAFNLMSMEANRNDDNGTSLKTNTKTFVLKPSDRSGAVVVFDDQIPPEVFVPVISSDPSIFDGRSFVSFVAQDKGTGVAKYEWAHSYVFSPDESDWMPAGSPLELSKSLLWQKIYIKAVDTVGNSTVVSVASTRHYAAIWFGVIIMVLVLCVLFLSVRPSSYRSS